MIKRAVVSLIVAQIAVPAFFGVAASDAPLSALRATVTAPSDNPTTDEKVALGRLLFWDPILSGPRDVACATCHHPRFGYADNLDLSRGAIPPAKRNSQTILNAAFNGADRAGRHDAVQAPMFWDLRVRSLEAQALRPLQTREEMCGDVCNSDRAVDGVVARLAEIPEYRARFEHAFGGPHAVSAANLGRAIAAFERTLVTANSPFDRFERGDRSAMTAAQMRGMRSFLRLGCANCHKGAMFSDYRAHVIGVPDNPKLPSSDTGVSNTYAFRTPTLRNLAYTAPYMHNGVFQTLEDVFHFYANVGGADGRFRNPHVALDDLDVSVRSISVFGERDDVVAFMQALSDPTFDRTIPASVPSGLAVGGRIR